MPKAPRRVVIHDEADARLRLFWRAGDLLDGTPHHYGVTSREHLYSTLAAHRRRHGRIHELQLWLHASSRGMVVDGQYVNLHEIAEAVQTPEGRGVRDYWWIRGCRFAENLSRMESLVETAQCAIVAHTKTISAEPWWAPWRQGGIVTIRPGERTFWNPRDDTYTRGPKKGRRLPGVSVTRMSPPPKSTIDGRPVF